LAGKHHTNTPYFPKAASVSPALFNITKAAKRMPLYHLVCAVDPIFESDIKGRVNDGLPETLPEWI
jgi:hypothetical protein